MATKPARKGTPPRRPTRHQAAAPAAPTPQQFLEALYQVAPGESLPAPLFGFLASFPSIDNPRWKGFPWTGGDPLDLGFGPGWRGSWDKQNVYATVSVFEPDRNGECRRLKASFAGMTAVMVDDIGTKVERKRGLILPPSYYVETSPGNFQSWLFLDGILTDLPTAEALLDALVASGLAVDGKDPGMKGVTRFGRPPFGHNDKQRYVEKLGHPFKVRCAEWRPERRYSVEEITAAYDLTLAPKRRTFGPPPPPAVMDAAHQQFDVLLRSLSVLGLYQQEKRDGWHEITCPWFNEHTDGRDDGAAVSAPCEANAYRGGFRCHHGSHEGRGIRDLRAEVQERLLAEVEVALKKATAKQGAK